MPPLTPELAGQLTELLQQQRAELMEHVHTHGAAAPGDVPAIGPAAHMTERDDASDAERISAEEASIVTHDDSLLGAINRALGRLEAGGAGICLSCGIDIPAERLLSNPVAEYCIDCQRDVEIGARDKLRGAWPTM